MRSGPAAGRRRPSETLRAWPPPTGAPTGAPAADDGWSRGEDDRVPPDDAEPAAGRGTPWRRVGAVVVVLAAVVAGARLAGVELPAVPSSPSISVEDAAPGALPGSPGDVRDGRARWEVGGQREVVVDPRSGAVVPGGADDPGTRTAGTLAPDPVGIWWPTPAAPIAPRSDATALWTGPCGFDASPPTCGVVVIWGGGREDPTGEGVHRDGALLQPDTQRWSPIPEAPVRATSPLPAVWAGDRLVVWGGVDPTGATARDDAALAATGAVYDPNRGEWEALPPPPISGRTGHALVWTGTEVVVWGGGRRAVDGGWLDLDDGAAYHPDTGTWRLLPVSPLAARTGAAAVAADDRVVVWGGHAGGDGAHTGTRLSDGAVLSANEGVWRPLPEVRAQPVRDPGEPVEATLLAEGNRILLAAPFVVSWRRPVYAVHELGGRRWRYPDAPGGLLWREAAVVGDPDRVVVWGGRPSRRPRPDGAIAVMAGMGWPLPPSGPEPRDGQAVVWADDVLVVWGGEGATDPRAALWTAGPAGGS